MITLKIALRYLLRRKARMLMIGFLVFLGTTIIILGETFSISAKYYSKKSIIQNFTGDLILYSEKSKEKPSPFSFTTPLPIIPNPHRIELWLDSSELVNSYVAIAQNYGLMSIEKNNKKTDVPFIFYAVNPVKYKETFQNISMVKGTFFGATTDSIKPGIVLSQFQNKNYRENYSIDCDVGDKVTLLSLTDGGSVNAYPSEIIGIYKPKFYKNVFDYINFLDIATYSKLYNFTGVDNSSLPSEFNNALSTESDEDIFALANEESLKGLNTEQLRSQDINGYTLIAIKLKNSKNSPKFIDEIKKQNFGINTATWKEASSFFAYIASIIQGVIFAAAFLIFLIVVFILMNSLIINILERTGEIGTLRAMGGEKNFITSIFLWESLILNGTAALIGMVISFFLIIVVKFSGGVALPEVMAQYLIGGGELQILLSIRPFIEAFIIIMAVSILATIYPIRVATSITPLLAMSEKN